MEELELNWKLSSKEVKLVRFLLTLFLGWVGSVIINHSRLKPKDQSSNSLAYFFVPLVCFLVGFVLSCILVALRINPTINLIIFTAIGALYPLIASIVNLYFDPDKLNFGYKFD